MKTDNKAPIKFGAGGPRRRLTVEQVHEARKQYRAGTRAIELAVKYGVSHAAIYNVLAGRGAYEGI